MDRESSRRSHLLMTQQAERRLLVFRGSGEMVSFSFSLSLSLFCCALVPRQPQSCDGMVAVGPMGPKTHGT